MSHQGAEVHGAIASHGGPIFVGNSNFSANNINFNDRQGNDQYECLRDLYLTDPNAEKARLEAQEERLIETSYNWIFEDDSFQAWLHDENVRILRITGDPGKGKTMTMIGIINNLAQKIPRKPSAIAFFFCRATDDRLSSSNGIIRGLLHHLLSQKSNERLVRHLKAKYDNVGLGLFDGSMAIFALQDVLFNILEDTSFENFYFLVDALDECTSGLEDLLKLIRLSTSRPRKLKWLVSGRNHIDVDRFFRCLDNPYTISLEHHAPELRLGVEDYIQSRVDILSRRHEYSLHQKQQITAYLSAKAEGTFLWVHLACQSLDRTMPARALRSLENMPPGLDDMYDRMARILQEINTDPEDLTWCSLILSTATVALRPLRVPELISIITAASTDTLDIAVELTKLIARCGSFLSLQDGVVYFIHQSAKEYLERSAGQSGSQVSETSQSHHNNVAKNCLFLIRKRLRQDVCDLKLPGFLSSELTSDHIRVLFDMEYACCNWALHLNNQHDNLPQWLVAAVDSFFDRDLLHWIEALALLKKLGDGIAQLTHLDAVYRNKAVNLSTSKIVDAKRFILEHRMVLETAPLQLYSTAIIFSPQDSRIKSHYKSYVPEWVTSYPQTPSRWGGLLRFFDVEPGSGFISAMAISSDDRLVAAAFSSRLIRIWNMDTGLPLLQDFWTEYPDTDLFGTRFDIGRSIQIRDIKFSPDNKKILVASAPSFGLKTSLSIFDLEARSWTTILASECFPVKPAPPVF
ncbi:hypothetical protein TWF696_003356 [Orbilia brochopaga]|uniref:NACHT domain-containing protein n=1 Tax=Orbilia brochopaga TaxID=3140254 RepID=A0AAV9TX79_9PEZI